jgi:bifunctional non-homologous end joining protein LigD
MADQLSLSLEADRAGWPGAIRAMIPQLADEPFDDPDMLFEPWWGGERALAYVGRDLAPEDDPAGSLDVRLVSADGVLLTGRVPEVAGLPACLGERAAILDGTLVAVDETGRLDEVGLAARLDGQPGPGLAFLVYDLLSLDGRSLAGEPLERRRARLVRLLRPTPSIVLVPTIAGEGRALSMAAAAQGVGWVLARDRRGPYLAGVTSSLWRLIAVSPAEPGAPPSPPPASTSEFEPSGGAGPTTSPILALFRRLPLDDQA